MIKAFLMDKYKIGLDEIIGEVESILKSGKKLRIIPSDNGDFPRLISELEKRGIDYCLSPENSYEVDLRKIDLI